MELLSGYRAPVQRDGELAFEFRGEQVVRVIRQGAVEMREIGVSPTICINQKSV